MLAFPASAMLHCPARTSPRITVIRVTHKDFGELPANPQPNPSELTALLRRIAYRYLECAENDSVGLTVVAVAAPKMDD